MSALLASVILGLAPSPVPEAAAPVEAGVTLPDGMGAHALVAGLSLAAWATSETIFKSDFAPLHCRWCDLSPNGVNTLNKIDTWGLRARWPVNLRPAADTTSSLVAFVALPAFLIAFELLDRRGAGRSLFVTDAILMAEAVGVAVLVDQVVKFSVARARPYVHDPSTPPSSLPDLSANLSFFSGHATFAFAMTAAAGTLALMRGSKYAWLVWAIGLPVAIGVSYLRMAADMHYLTDVAVGAAVGTFYGVGIPVLHGRMAAGPGGMQYKVTF